MQPDGRRLNPGGAKNFTDVNEGAESLHVLTQPQCVQEPEHASICSPTKTVLALIETIRHVRCDPAMHQPLEDLESARWVCDGLARQSELPKLRDHVPSEDQLKKKLRKFQAWWSCVRMWRHQDLQNLWRTRRIQRWKQRRRGEKRTQSFKKSDLRKLYRATLRTTQCTRTNVGGAHHD